MAAKDYIYKANYAGWYCVSDETFLTESQLKENEQKEKVSAESGHPVKWIEESNYMFRLSKVQNEIEYWIKNRFVYFCQIITHQPQLLRSTQISHFLAIQFVRKNSKKY